MEISDLWYTLVYDSFFTYFRFKHLPKGQPLSDDQLRAALDNITENFKGMASQLQKLGSTQSNENFNNIVASKAPKNRYDVIMLFCEMEFPLGNVAKFYTDDTSTCIYFHKIINFDNHVIM